MLALVMLGTVLNYLARASLSVEAPTLKTELAMTTQQYSWVVMAFQGTYALMQPVAGAILDKLGTRLGLALFAVAWSFATMSHALARHWSGLLTARGLLGASEAAAVPAGLRVVSGWFLPHERSMAAGWFNIASVGNIIAPAFVAACILWGGWRSAFVIIGVLSLAWAALWYAFYRDPPKPEAASARQADPAVEWAVDSERPAPIPDRFQLLRSRGFWSIAIPRFLAEPTWQTLNFFIPLFLVARWHVSLHYIALWAWLPFVGADLGVLFGGYLSPFLVRWAKMPLLLSRKVVATIGALGMVCVAAIGLIHDPGVALALFSLGAFMHQMLAIMLVTLTADLFPIEVVGSAAGLAGFFSWSGGLLFTAVLGALVDKTGYSPLFASLPVLDLIGLAILWLLLPARPSEA